MSWRLPIDRWQDSAVDKNTHKMVLILGTREGYRNIQKHILYIGPLKFVLICNAAISLLQNQNEIPCIKQYIYFIRMLVIDPTSCSDHHWIKE